jgi:hypothetical protein
MTEKDSISYKIYDKSSIMVYCDKDRFQKDMKLLNGIWNNNGFLISKNKEKDLIKFINSLKLKQVANNFKSRKEQNKYHREVSESESVSSDSDSEKDDSGLDSDSNSINESSDEDDEDDKGKNQNQNMIRKGSKDSKKEKEKEIKKDSQKVNKYLKDDPLLYYKSFKVKPVEFKKMNNYVSESESEDNFSSSSESSSSEDSFPEPRTPKKRKKYYSGKKEEYNDLYKEVQNLQRKIYKIEIENKKLKSNKS